MSKPPVLLAKTLEQVSALAQSARAKGNGRIILVPVDFSEHSLMALGFAATLAESLQEVLIVLHVIHDPADMPGYYAKLTEQQQHLERIEDVAEDAFRDFMSHACESFPDCSTLQEADCFMVVGLPVTRILEVAGELDPFMVVMGSQGRTGLGNLIVGSKAAQIVQLCPFPVTIVKNRENPVND
jgi:nucleotide-binding universal stress UspA family protein